MTDPKDVVNAAKIVEAPARLPDYSVMFLSSVKPERVRFLDDYGMIPAGMLSLMAGSPGDGKSTFACDLTARVTRTGRNVIYLTAEDSYAAMVRPRMEAAGADLDRVAFITLRDDAPLWLPDHISVVEAVVEEHAAALLILDPLLAFLPHGIDSFKDQSVRSALRPVYKMAEVTGCTVLALVHLNKSNNTGINRIGGSVAFVGAARSAILLGRNPQSPDGSERIVCHLKSNAGEEQRSQLWRIERVLIPGDGTRPELTTSRISHVGASHLTKEDVLGAAVDTTSRSAQSEAEDFLQAELSEGAVAVQEIQVRRAGAGLSEAAVRRAKESLGVIPEKRGFGERGKWFWMLPADPGDAPKALIGERLSAALNKPHNQVDSEASRNGNSAKALKPENMNALGDALAFEVSPKPSIDVLLMSVNQARSEGQLPGIEDEWWADFTLACRDDPTDAAIESLAAILASATTGGGL